MLFVTTKKQKVLFILLCMFITGILIKQAYNLNNSIVITNTQQKAYVAIIIDDFGYNGIGTDEMLSLNVPITAAVIPFLEKSTADAKKVHDAGKEIIVHMSMDSHTGKKSWLGPKAITTDLSDEIITNTVLEALNEIQWAVGINNHMGSKATEDSRIMKDILSITSQKNLIFIDSVTTAKSVTSSVAKETGSSFFYRDVFLDSTQDQNKVQQNLIALGNIALKKGYAVGIGHVGPEGGKVTAAAIAKIAPELEKKGITFVTISELKQIVYGNK